VTFSLPPEAGVQVDGDPFQVGESAAPGAPVRVQVRLAPESLQVLAPAPA
jgi:hypothetical protein